MPLVEQVICDRCKAVKRDTNRWWVAFVWPGCIQIVPFGEFDRPADRRVQVSYLCGRACVVEAVSEFMEQTGT